MSASQRAMSLSLGTIAMVSGTQTEQSADPASGRAVDVTSGRTAVSGTTAASCRRRSFARARARQRCSRRRAMPCSVARYACPATQTSQRRFASRQSHEQNRCNGWCGSKGAFTPPQQTNSPPRSCTPLNNAVRMINL